MAIVRYAILDFQRRCQTSDGKMFEKKVVCLAEMYIIYNIFSEVLLFIWNIPRELYVR